MIEISIDKTRATPEELVALAALPGYAMLVASAAARGREAGVLLTVKEPLGGALGSQLAEAGEALMTAGPSDSASLVSSEESEQLGFAEGDWVADFSDADRPRLARVKDAYSLSGEVLLDLVLYSKDGTRIGRESPACGGPRGFEPACPAENWTRIEEPDFDYLARGSKYHWGDRVQRLECSLSHA